MNPISSARAFRVAVASGKGGAGKTTVTANLALTARRRGWPVAVLDCDVEEPNAHLFLRPEFDETRSVHIPAPEANEELCNYCNRCGQACRFHAILALGSALVLYPDLCHGCGGCVSACPTGALREVPHVIGRIDAGQADGIRFVRGLLRVGAPLSPPVIRAVLQTATDAGLVLCDAPPGNACPAVETLRGADYALLVTEPTPFGLHDLEIAVEATRQLGVPFGVVINRAGSGDPGVQGYCLRERIPVHVQLPDDRRAAEAGSRGELLVDAVPEFRRLFEFLLDDLPIPALDGGARSRMEAAT